MRNFDSIEIGMLIIKSAVFKLLNNENRYNQLKEMSTFWFRNSNRESIYLFHR